MTKIVYNACFGGFSLSDEAVELYLKLKGKDYTKEDGFFGSSTYKIIGDLDDGDYDYFSERSDIERDDPVLVQVVEQLGKKANGPFAELRIEDIPPGTYYRIDEYDGNESIEFRDDINWKIA